MTVFRFAVVFWLLIILPLVLGQSVNVVSFAGTGASTPVVNGARTSATFNNVHGLMFDRSGNIIAVDRTNNLVRKISPQGIVSTLAGSGAASSLDGQDVSASFNTPHLSAIDSVGNIYVTEFTGNVVRKISPTGYVSKFAGSVVGSGGWLDSQGTYSRFNGPHGIAVDSSDNLYITEWYNHRIRKITSTGDVTTVAGSGTSAWLDGRLTTASFANPSSVALDANNNLYIADFNNNRIRKIDPTGLVSTVAGSGLTTGVDGQGSSASIFSPIEIQFDVAGTMYVSDFMGHRIRKISPSGYVSSVAGLGTAAYLEGPGTIALFSNPSGLLVLSATQLLVGDRGNNRIRKITMCPPNSHYYAESCVCDSGLTMFANGTCSQCPLGTVLLNSNSFACTQCSAGTFRSAILTNCTACPVGAESNADRSGCVNCGLGKYRTTGMTNCSDCPVGTEVSTERSSCLPCQLGKYSNSSNSYVCSDCPLGFESSANKQTCNVCSTVKYRPALTFQTCIDCPMFATCSASAIISCSSGYKINAARTACEECPVGTQSSGDFLSCVSCTVGTNYRSSLVQSSCQTCPSNAVCSTASSFTCNAGYELTGDGFGCQTCQEGYSKSASGNTACTQCPVGEESFSNKQSCISCGTGKYRPNLLVNKCIPCPPNGICSSSALTKCANGFKINAGGDGCEQCPIGEHSLDGLNCQACPANSFKPDQSFATCISCPSGSSCSGSIVSCQTGYFFDTNAQCKRNDTYFALMQTATNNLSPVTSFITVTQPASTSTITSTVTSGQTGTITILSPLPNNVQTVTVSQQTSSPQTVTVSVSGDANAGSGSQQAQSANSVNLDFIGLTLPISPLIFAAAAFGAGLFIMLIISLVCCRKPRSRKRDEEFDGMTTTTGMNTQSQRTFTNNSMTR